MAIKKPAVIGSNPQTFSAEWLQRHSQLFETVGASGILLAPLPCGSLRFPPCDYTLVKVGRL